MKINFPNTCLASQEIYERFNSARPGAGIVALATSLIIATRFIQGKRPRNGLIVVPSGGGKTDILSCFFDKRLKIIEPASRGTVQGILSSLDKKFFDNSTWIITDITVFLQGLKGNQRVEFWAFLAKFLEDGFYDTRNRVEKFQVKGRINLIFGITDKFFRDNRAALIESTAMNRIIPFNITYVKDQEDDIVNSINSELSLPDTKFLRKLKKQRIIWQNSIAINNFAQKLALRLQTSRKELLIARSFQDIRDLAKANALINGRIAVNHEDLQMVEYLSFFMLNNYFFSDICFKIIIKIRTSDCALTAKLIAEELNVSERTVEHYLQELRKLEFVDYNQSGKEYLYKSDFIKEADLK